MMSALNQIKEDPDKGGDVEMENDFNLASMGQFCNILLSRDLKTEFPKIDSTLKRENTLKEKFKETETKMQAMVEDMKTHVHVMQTELINGANIDEDQKKTLISLMTETRIKKRCTICFQYGHTAGNCSLNL